MKVQNRILSMFLTLALILGIFPAAIMHAADSSQASSLDSGNIAIGESGNTELSIQPRSLLPPVHRESITLYLTNKTPQSLETLPASDLINAVNAAAAVPIASGSTVLWDYTFDANGNRLSESFQPLSGTVNLNQQNHSWISFELIAGSGSQLDAAYVRYEVTVWKNQIPEFFLDLFAQAGQASICDRYNYSTSNNAKNYSIWLPDSYSANAEYYLNLDSFYDSNYTTKIYKGHFDSATAAEAAAAADITAQMLNRSLDGYKANYSTAQPFTIIYKLGSEVVLLQKFTVEVELYSDYTEGYPDLRGIYADRSGTRTDIQYNTEYQYDEVTDTETCLITLDPGYAPGNAYYTGFSYYVGNAIDNSKVTKAVLGHYDSLAAASAQADIKSQLMVDDTMLSTVGIGYKAIFMDGVNFTIFAGGEAYKYTVLALEHPGSVDTYLNITGAVGVSNVYKMLSKDDSGAQQYGYQILLVDDSTADLTNLKPVFTTAYGIEAFVGGNRQTSGQDGHNFSNKAIQYVAQAENKKDVKNYWVSFVKAVPGAAKLFVVVDGENPAERVVNFDAYTGSHHDIFISNIGAQTLTGLNVTLENAQNVKLDDYWRVGGAGNDTLAGFTTAIDNGYGELSNIAKIRLVPTGEGAVSGTLVITSANGGGPIRITLQGESGNPQITTAQLNDAVKYVPYSYMLESDNKYSWNKTTFSEAGSSLSAIGLDIRPSGEIYGVPLQDGPVTFTVEMRNSHLDFSDVTKTFTLNVLSNTTANVDATIDSGYEIKTWIGGGPGGHVTGYQTRDFESKGDIGDFIDFWIDGDRLQENVDYTKRSGSTVITIQSQTFQRYGTGEHTIAAEFRVDGNANKDLKRSAQNYTLNSSGSSSSSGSGSSGMHSWEGSASTSSLILNTTLRTKSNGDYEFILDGSGKSLEIRMNKEFTLYQSMTMDDEEYVQGKDYTAKSGSTILTIKASSLEKLADGKHTIRAKFTDQTVRIDFTLVRGEITDLTQTAENTGGGLHNPTSGGDGSDVNRNSNPHTGR